MQRFLAGDGKVEFVLALPVKSDGSQRSAPENLRIVAKTWVSSRHSPGAQIATYLHETLPAQFPNPENNPLNAYGTSNEGKSFNGGEIMSSRSIKISSRAVANLLAGRTTQQNFTRYNPHVEEYFAHALSRARRVIPLSAQSIDATPIAKWPPFRQSMLVRYVPTGRSEALRVGGTGRSRELVRAIERTLPGGMPCGT